MAGPVHPETAQGPLLERRAMDADSDLLLSLYREARTLPTAEFQLFAIRLIRPVLRFESAVWGAGYFSGPPDNPSLVPIRSASHEIDPAGFAYWKSINRADKIIPQVRQAPWTTFNFHAPSVFAAKGDSVMRDYAERFGRQSYLCTALAREGTPVFEWCSLYRPDPDDQFSEGERARCQGLVKHFSEALMVNQLAVESDAPAAGKSDGDEFAALVDPAGTILSAQFGFIMACRRQWREFDERRISYSVMRQLLEASQGIYRGRSITLKARRLAEFLRITATAATVDSPLPPRQTDIATLFAQGHSNKEIAKLLGIAPSTVRNQLAASYRSLGAANRTELKAQLERRFGSASQ